MRLLFWVQHLLGVGHLSRAASLARALSKAGIRTTLVSGGAPVPDTDTGTARFVQLPPTRAVDVRFKVLVDGDGHPIDDAWRSRRRDALLAAYEAAGPDIVVTELFPFGRRQLRFELEPLLAEARADGCRIVSSVRDILVEPDKPSRIDEMLDRVVRLYDLVLVHGDSGLIPFDTTFPRLAGIADRVRYTGYVVEPPAAAVPSGEVVVSAGGGAVGEPLLRAALAAKPLSRARNLFWRLLVGHGLPDGILADIAASAGSGCLVERARPDFRELLGGARLSISQGGYNTVLEVLSAGTRAVIVPYAGGRESEQTLRAGRLAARGALQVVPEADLTAEALARAVDAALAGPPAAATGIDLGGIRTTVSILEGFGAG